LQSSKSGSPSEIHSIWFVASRSRTRSEFYFRRICRVASHHFVQPRPQAYGTQIRRLQSPRAVAQRVQVRIPVRTVHHHEEEQRNQSRSSTHSDTPISDCHHIPGFLD